MSPSAADDDLDESVGTPEDHGEENTAGKPGRKKNPNTQAARRDQNRIAQREFRLRKQQKIRDLEARVELLSGDKAEVYSQMKDIVQSLMHENTQLRALLKALGGFIGDGVGGHLHDTLNTMGWTMDQFHGFVSRSETDTAFETFQALKRKKDVTNGSTSGSPTVGDDPEARKRRRLTDPAPPPPIPIPNRFGIGAASTPTTSASFASLMDSQIFRPPTGSTFAVPGPSNIGPSGNNPLGTAATDTPSPVNMYGTSSFAPALGSYYTSTPRTAASASNSLPPITTTSTSTATSDSLFSSESVGSGEDESVLRKNEAGRLFRYHLDNFRRNPSYCLPRSLNPTLVQRTVAHEQIIDSIPFPELRDRMILLKDRYSLAEVIHSLFLHSTIHGDDVLQHTNWELHKPWLERYPFLLDETTLAVANKWRRERGEAEIKLSDLLKDG